MTKASKRCIAHHYRPAVSPCKSCGKAICEECDRQFHNLCPSCANMPMSAPPKKEPSPPPPAAKPAEKRAAPSLPKLSLKGPVAYGIAAVLLLALIALVTMGSMGVGPFPFRPKKLETGEVSKLSMQSMYMVVVAVDAFKKRTGRLPKDLPEIGWPNDPALTYVVASPTRYVLSSKKGLVELTYDSAQDPSVFFAGIPSPINPTGADAK